jgi:hypothetical protein
MLEAATSDRGPQFISAFTSELCQLTGVMQKLSTQTDGNTEILNRTSISGCLCSSITSKTTGTTGHGFRPGYDELTGLSPFESEFEYKPRRHFDWEERMAASSASGEQLTRGQAQQFTRRAHGPS